MRKLLVMSFFVLILTACNGEKDAKSYIYWAEETEAETERLDEAGVRYEIKDGEILVIEEDMFKAVECCSYVHGYD